MTFTLCPNYCIKNPSSLNLLDKNKGSAARMAKSGCQNTYSPRTGIKVSLGGNPQSSFYAVLTIESKSFPSPPKVLSKLPLLSNVTAAQNRQTALSFCIVPFQGKPDDYDPEDEEAEPLEDEEDNWQDSEE